jgi:hypothetical protein
MGRISAAERGPKSLAIRLRIQRELRALRSASLQRGCVASCMAGTPRASSAGPLPAATSTEVARQVAMNHATPNGMRVIEEAFIMACSLPAAACRTLDVSQGRGLGRSRYVASA